MFFLIVAAAVVSVNGTSYLVAELYPGDGGAVAGLLGAPALVALVGTPLAVELDMLVPHTPAVWQSQLTVLGAATGAAAALTWGGWENFWLAAIGLPILGVVFLAIVGVFSTPFLAGASDPVLYEALGLEGNYPLGVANPVEVRYWELTWGSGAWTMALAACVCSAVLASLWRRRSIA